jgi:transposase
MRPKGTSAQLEQRRRDALTLLRLGHKPAAVAKALNASLVSVGRWRAAALAGGAKALAAKPVPGRPPKLDHDSRTRLGRLLLRDPRRHGFATGLWTLARVAEVIQRQWGVQYHPSQVWRILLSLGWRCQMPQTRRRERDEPAIARWKRVDWPRIKKRGQARQKRAVSR